MPKNCAIHRCPQVYRDGGFTFAVRFKSLARLGEGCLITTTSPATQYQAPQQRIQMTKDNS